MWSQRLLTALSAAALSFPIAVGALTSPPSPTRAVAPVGCN